MTAEGIDIIIAGSDTTATTLGNLFHRVLASPDIEKQLQAELDAAMPDRDANPPLAKLERLDYLVSNLCPGNILMDP
jgi:cytochrome P450